MQEKFNIYLVEDELIIAKNMEIDLRGFGYDVVGKASTGEKAIDEILEIKPDLVLMDVHLDGSLTGIETAELLLEKVNIPIIFLTASKDEEILTQATEVGAFGFIVKPFESHDLKSAIEVAFAKHDDIKKVKLVSKRSAMALEESERRYKQIVDSVRDLIYRTNHRGCFTFVNPAVPKLTEYDHDEIVGMHYSKLVRPDHQEKVLKFYRNVFNDRITDTYYEFPIVTKTGKELWIGQNVQLQKTGNRVIGFQATARDITDRVKYQEALIKSKEEAESAVKIKSQFMANISHELRTPLNGIIGVAKLLTQTGLSPQQEKYLSAIVTSSDQLMGVINNVLDLSKIEAERMVLEEREFDIYELMSGLTELFETRSQQKGLRFHSKIDGNVPKTIIGDSVKLNQILFNLVGNSIKFTEQGEVFIHVRMVDERDKTFFLEIEVRDTGIGIDKEKLKTIFQAFSQAEGETTRKYGGSGLGLTIVKKLVELHKGHILVESEPGQGSSFSVQLPFKKLVVPAVNEEGELTQFINPKMDIAGLHVLLAEDNLINQMVTKDLLKNKGVTVEIANNGEEALEKLSEGNFDVVLMDIQMPVMDGYEAMSTIRSEFSEPKRSVPILALTAHAMGGELERCRKNGADDYLTKPYDPNELYDKLRELTNLPRLNGVSNQKKVSKVKKSIDIEALRKFVNGDDDLLYSTLELIHDSFHEDLDLISEFVLEKDADRIQKLGHKMKPNYALIGLTDLSELCEKIEFEPDFNLQRGMLDELIPRTKEILKDIYSELNEHSDESRQFLTDKKEESHED